MIFRSATDQTPLRETLESITNAAQINFWLDRQVDPTQLVSLGTETKTPYEAIQKAAIETGLSAAAVDNIVIVGRPAWVQSLVCDHLGIAAQQHREADQLAGAQRTSSGPSPSIVKHSLQVAS